MKLNKIKQLSIGLATILLVNGCNSLDISNLWNYALINNICPVRLFLTDSVHPPSARYSSPKFILRILV